jgi:hypothetical protein
VKPESAAILTHFGQELPSRAGLLSNDSLLSKPRWSRIPVMPENSVAYQCECGKKWNFTAKQAATPASLKCKCGRNIVIQDGFIYSTKKPEERA